jgi:hypothetical protein
MIYGEPARHAVCIVDPTVRYRRDQYVGYISDEEIHVRREYYAGRHATRQSMMPVVCYWTAPEITGGELYYSESMHVGEEA